MSNETTQMPHTSLGETALDVAERAARVAGRVIMERFPEMTGPASERRVLVSNKGWNNLVTDVDRTAEAAVLEVLTTAFPAFSVLAEESGGTTGTEPYTWYIDPIDGTRNFASGIPHLAVNIALSHQGRLIVGVTLDPVRDEMFSATLGGGTFLNGKRVTVSETAELVDSVLGFDMGYVDERGRHLLEMLLGLWPGMQSIRLMGSAALGMAYAAVGRVQIYAHHHVQPWDIAPGILLVQEAGGTVTDIEGRDIQPESGTVVAAGPLIHSRFMAATEDTAWRKG